MLRRYVLASILVAFPALASGCATIINGSTQEVSVSSIPPGATVDIDGEQQYTTPFTAELERKRDHLLTFTMPGYESTQITLNHTLSGAVAGNILAGGLIGWGVDAASGAQYKLVPDTVAVTLQSMGYANGTQRLPDQSLPTYQPISEPPQQVASYTPPPVPPGNSDWLVEPVAEAQLRSKLDQLDRLHAQGHITQSEWQRARSAVIGSMSVAEAGN